MAKHQLLAFSLLALAASLPAAMSGCTAPVDYGIAMDESGSIGAANFQTLKTFVVNLINNICSSNNARVYVNKFGSSTVPVPSSNTALTSDCTTVATGVSNTAYGAGWTYMVPALQNLFDKFTDSSRLRVAVLITDGQPSEGEAPVLNVASAMKAAGITLVTIGIGSGIDVAFLQNVASDRSGGGKLYFGVSQFDQLNGILASLSVQICPITCAPFTIAQPTGSCTVPACTTTDGLPDGSCATPYTGNAQDASTITLSPSGPYAVGTTDVTVTATYTDNGQTLTQTCSSTVTVTKTDTDGDGIANCEDSCNNAGSDVCPTAAAARAALFTVTPNPGCQTATVTYTSDVLNGQCSPSPISWVTLAVNGVTDQCLKGSDVTQGQTITLSNVPCNSKVTVYAHDGSYKNANIELSALQAALVNRCRSNDKQHNCNVGSYDVVCSCDERRLSLRRLY